MKEGKEKRRREPFVVGFFAVSNVYMQVYTLSSTYTLLCCYGRYIVYMYVLSSREPFLLDVAVKNPVLCHNQTLFSWKMRVLRTEMILCVCVCVCVCVTDL